MYPKPETRNPKAGPQLGYPVAAHCVHCSRRERAQERRILGPSETGEVLQKALFLASGPFVRHGSFRKLGVPYSGVLVIRILQKKGIILGMPALLRILQRDRRCTYPKESPKVRNLEPSETARRGRLASKIPSKP